MADSPAMGVGVHTAASIRRRVTRTLTSTMDKQESRPLIGEAKRGHSSSWEGIKKMLFESWLNLLLFIIPVAVWSYYRHWSGTWVFVLNFVAMVPLANLLGTTTEILAIHTGETIGGLVNATFGNAVEVVIAIFALKAGEVEVVQSSLIGSCLSNLLLVLGSSFFFAGIAHSESSFNQTGANASSSLLMLSSFAMLMPAYCEYVEEGSAAVEAAKSLSISHIAAICLFFMYLQMLVFQLATHKHLFEDDNAEEDEPEISFFAAASLLLVLTLVVACLSEYLVSGLDGFAEHLGISKAFIGVILLPVVGNAVEHVTAVKVAYHGKMELAMGVAVGSATQVALFVVPVVVMAGWIMGQPMSLAFARFQIVMYLMSVLIVYAVIADGKSNWLEGSLLLTCYVLIAGALLYIG